MADKKTFLDAMKDVKRLKKLIEDRKMDTDGSKYLDRGELSQILGQIAKEIGVDNPTR